MTLKEAMEEFLKNAQIEIIDSIEFQLTKKEDKINEEEAESE